MRFRLQVDGKEYAISATPDGVVTIDGEAFESKTGSVTADRRMIQLGDKNYEIRIVESTEEVGCFTLEVAGERVPLTVSDLVREMPPTATAAAGSAGASATSDEDAAAGGRVSSQAGPQDGLFAPVPGKIVEVFVKPGDEVDEGTPLLVLEAMKMENELRAPKKGRVSAVLVTKGDTAERGQLLVGLE